MIAELEAEVDRQALLRNHEVVTSLLFHNNTFICSHGRLYSLKLKLDRKIDKLEKSKDYCDIVEKEALIDELRRCNMELAEAIKCGSCCFCSPIARAERARRPKKQKKEQTFANSSNYMPTPKYLAKRVKEYFDEYCQLILKDHPDFDLTEATKEYNEILENQCVINPDTFEPELEDIQERVVSHQRDIESIKKKLELSEERIIKSRISAIGFEPT